MSLVSQDEKKSLDKQEEYIEALKKGGVVRSHTQYLVQSSKQTTCSACRLLLQLPSTWSAVLGVRLDCTSSAFPGTRAAAAHRTQMRISSTL